MVYFRWQCKHTSQQGSQKFALCRSSWADTGHTTAPSHNFLSSAPKQSQIQTFAKETHKMTIILPSSRSFFHVWEFVFWWLRSLNCFFQTFLPPRSPPVFSSMAVWLIVFFYCFYCFFCPPLPLYLSLSLFSFIQSYIDYKTFSLSMKHIDDLGFSLISFISSYFFSFMKFAAKKE